MTTSIVILTHNELPLTDKCLQSIRQHTHDYELIVVDNGSTDGTVAYLRKQPDIIVHENQENLGFAAGCNQGLGLSHGENILFLNNDTIVTAYWLENMLRVLYEDKRVGMVGPVTNYSSGHQMVPVTYSRLGELEIFARRHVQENEGCYTDVRRLVGFCLLAKRSVLEEIGGFDERFGLGNYEDDDLCLRALRAGYVLRVVQDAFIHHFGHATIRNLQDFDLTKLLDQNRKKASEKWGQDIHQLIYKPAVTISVCMITRDASLTLKRSLDSIAGHADEMIIVDTGSSDDTVELAKTYTSHVYIHSGKGEPSDSYLYAFEQATGEYIVWMRQDEVLDNKTIKRLSSLKLSIDGSEDSVALSDHHGKKASMYRRAAGFRMPDQWGEGV
ncbi:glycosyltransferase family 2 protein [Paenibacillus filicis]|uniref:Glycosyltransferase family 2 protein n=1 Tax=Paenibacillus filicis TaxID=669464 RepID=A0ABU9DLH0_9BACL